MHVRGGSMSRKPFRRRRRRQATSPLAGALFVLPLAGTAAAQGLSFIWYFDQQNDASIPQCGTLDISIGPLDNITTPPVPPYYLISYPTRATPTTFDASAADGGVFSWNVGYPAGTQFMLGMVDSQGNSGGIVRVYSVASGTSTCPMYQTSNNDFGFSITPASQPRTCQNVDFDVNGGVPPYTVTTAISMDTAVNQTFPNSSISVQNVLSGGATYILALSDSTGSYAASPDLIYSGGGRDTSCLVTTPTTSNRPTKSSSPDKETSSKNPAIIGSVVGICAVLLIAAAGAFIIYRRKKNARHESYLAGRLSGAAPGGGGAGSDSSAYGGSGNGREKFVSPMGNGGGMWRPESPTEYPGITSAPVRFRVTNPDDDARSERSFRIGGGARNLAGLGGGMRDSEDTIRSNGSNGKSWPVPNGGDYNTRDRAQRQSLIESDANSLYPPTPYRGATGSATARYGPGSAGSTGSTGSFEDADQPWPTYSSAASSETEDHYTDLPASSAGILGNNRAMRIGSRSSNAGQEGNGGNSGGKPRGMKGTGSQSDEMDVEEMYSSEVYANVPHSEALNSDPKWDSFTRPGISNSPSNAYGSPFADSQRVTS